MLIIAFMQIYFYMFFHFYLLLFGVKIDWFVGRSNVAMIFKPGGISGVSGNLIYVKLVYIAII